MMLNRSIIKASLAFAALALPALADAPAPSEKSLPQAVIRFADQGGIQDWRADGETGIFIKDRNNHWFHAQLMFPCHGLPFHESEIGFESEPDGDFDNLSFIKVGGQHCQVASLVAAAKPTGAMP